MTRERIKQVRKTLGLKQAEFARKIGLTQTSLSMIESGKSVITEKNIKLICITFNVSEVWLRTGEGETFTSASPYEQEFSRTIRGLMPETQRALLDIAKQLLGAQEKYTRLPQGRCLPQGEDAPSGEAGSENRLP